MRKLCKNCGQRPVGINYYKEGKTFFRSKCDHCARGYEKEKPRWVIAGYKKKTTCDRCGFTSKYEEQFNVFYVDGVPANCRFANLKTVCSNCQQILHILKLPWRKGDLVPDL